MIKYKPGTYAISGLWVEVDREDNPFPMTRAAVLVETEGGNKVTLATTQKLGDKPAFISLVVLPTQVQMTTALIFARALEVAASMARKFDRGE